MNKRLEIGNRIKKLRQEYKFSQTHVAEVLFISQAAYSLIESTQNGIVAEHIIKLAELYDVSTDFILTGNSHYIKVGRETGFVPLLRTHAHASYIQNIDDEKFFDIKDWFRIPGFDPTEDQTLFEVEGNSMAPTIFPGDILICQLHHDINYVLDGSAVVVITVDGITIQRLHQDENPEYFRLEIDNDNSLKKSDKIRKDEIRKLMMIRGKISSVLVPHHQIIGRQNFQDLQEGFNQLKDELYQMNKKLNSITNNK